MVHKAGHMFMQHALTDMATDNTTQLSMRLTLCLLARADPAETVVCYTTPLLQVGHLGTGHAQVAEECGACRRVCCTAGGYVPQTATTKVSRQPCLPPWPVHTREPCTSRYGRCLSNAASQQADSTWSQKMRDQELSPGMQTGLWRLMAVSTRRACFLHRQQDLFTLS